MHIVYALTLNSGCSHILLYCLSGVTILQLSTIIKAIIEAEHLCSTHLVVLVQVLVACLELEQSQILNSVCQR